MAERKVRVRIEGQDDASAKFKNVSSSMQELDGSASNLQQTIIGLGAAFSALKLGQSFISTAAEFEALGVALETVMGSSKKASESLSWITDFTAKTPYELKQVSDAFVRLSSYGIDATKELGILGDAASAMGKPLMMAVEAMADAATGQFERLREFGIRTEQIGDKVRMSYTENGAMMVKEVNKNNKDIIQGIEEIFERFRGGMEKQSATWTGVMSNMSDKFALWKKGVMDMGPFDKLKAALTSIYTGMETNLGQREMQGYARATADALSSVIDGFMEMFGAVAENRESILSFIGSMAEGLGSVAKVGVDAFKGIANAFGDLGDAFSGMNPDLRNMLIGAFLGKRFGAWGAAGGAALGYFGGNMASQSDIDWWKSHPEMEEKYGERSGGYLDTLTQAVGKLSPITWFSDSEMFPDIGQIRELEEGFASAYANLDMLTNRMYDFSDGFNTMNPQISESESLTSAWESEMSNAEEGINALAAEIRGTTGAYAGFLATVEGGLKVDLAAAMRKSVQEGQSIVTQTAAFVARQEKKYETPGQKLQNELNEINQRREQAAKYEGTEGLIAQLDALSGKATEGYMKRYYPARRGGGGGGGGRGPLDIDDLRNDLRRFEDVVKDVMSSNTDATYDFYIRWAEMSGDKVHAAEMQIEQETIKQKAALDKQVEQAEKAYEALQKKLGDRQEGKGGVTDEALGALGIARKKVDEARAAAEQGKQMIDANQWLRTIEKETELETNKAKTISDLKLRYAELTGTMEEQAKARIENIEAELEYQKIVNKGSPEVVAWLEKIAEAQKREQKAISGSFGEGFGYAMEQYRKEMPTIGQMGMEAFGKVKDAIDSSADAFVDFCMTGKGNFTDMINSMLSDLLKFIMRAAMEQAFLGKGGILGGLGGGSGGGIFGFLGSLFGGLFGGGPSTGAYGVESYAGIGGGYADGGTITEPIFGIGRSGRSYTLGESGPEEVVPHSRLKAPDTRAKKPMSVSVNVINQTTQPVTAQQKGTKIDLEQAIVSVVLKNADQGGDLYHAFKRGRR